MVVKKHDEIDNLEQEFRQALKLYRSLMRWGVDKVFQDAVVVIQALFTSSRQLLDEKNVVQASDELTRLLSQLRVMEQTYGEKKSALLNDTISQIVLMETLLDTRQLNRFNVFVQSLEKARHAVQHDDLQQGKVMLDQVINDYIEYGQQLFEQQRGQPIFAQSLQVHVEQKLTDVLKTRAFCKQFSLTAFEQLITRASAQNITTVSLAALGSSEDIIALFSSLSKQPINIDYSVANPWIMILRIAVTRDSTLYLVGIALDREIDIVRLSTLLSHLSAVVLNFNRLSLSTLQIDQLVLACLGQLHRKHIYVIDDETNTSQEAQPSIILDKVKANRLETMNQSYFVDWANRMIHFSPANVLA